MINDYMFMFLVAIYISLVIANLISCYTRTLLNINEVARYVIKIKLLLSLST